MRLDLHKHVYLKLVAVQHFFFHYLQSSALLIKCDERGKSTQHPVSSEGKSSMTHFECTWGIESIVIARQIEMSSGVDPERHNRMLIGKVARIDMKPDDSIDSHRKVDERWEIRFSSRKDFLLLKTTSEINAKLIIHSRIIFSSSLLLGFARTAAEKAQDKASTRSRLTCWW